LIGTVRTVARYHGGCTQTDPSNRCRARRDARRTASFHTLLSAATKRRASGDGEPTATGAPDCTLNNHAPLRDLFALRAHPARYGRLVDLTKAWA